LKIIGNTCANSPGNLPVFPLFLNMPKGKSDRRLVIISGADEPYEKLKRALRAEIDETAWRTLYSTVSRPFPVPDTGKIAVKVINHYGDEVLKVYRLNKEFNR